MQFSKAGVATLFVLSLLSTTARGQIQVFGGPEADRRSSTVVMFGEDVVVGVSISYSAPEWKDSYDTPGALDQNKGQNVRLGKNWWTSLDTNVPLEIGGTRLEPGAYFLGLHYGEDGSFKLLVIDSVQAMKESMMPFDPAGWKGGTMIPLKMSKDSLEETQDEMVIAITAAEGDPTKGSFSIQWGKHELSADVRFHVGGPNEASAGRSDKKDM